MRFDLSTFTYLLYAMKRSVIDIHLVGDLNGSL